MSALKEPEILSAWEASLQEAADQYPAVSFNGRTFLPACLLAIAREQAERVFLILDGTPVDRRSLGEAEQIIQGAGAEFLAGWGSTMTAFGTDGEAWAEEAAEAAVQAYHARLNDLAPGLHRGGRT